MEEVADGDFCSAAQLVLLAMGFLGPHRTGMKEQAGLTRDARGTVAAITVHDRTSMNRVFAAGDMRCGQSLAVWATCKGRQCARAIDTLLPA